jgi:hypothetical protein
MKEILKIFDAFYGGIQKGDKPTVAGAVSNIEEVDIFTNKDYIQPEPIMLSDSLPSGSELYAYDVDASDTLYGYGKETTNNYVRIFSLSSAAWIKASYNSGNNSLVSYGAEEGMDNAIFFGINL